MASVANTSNLKTAPSPTAALAKPSIAYHQVDNTFRLTTPENISFEYQLAGPFRRFFPYALDLGFVAVVFLVVCFVTWGVTLLIGTAFALIGITDVAEILIAFAAAIAPIGAFLAYWFYGAYMETYYNGQTIGKMLVGLRVLSTDGHAIDGAQAMLRNLFRLVDLMPFVSIGSLLEISEFPPQVALPTAIFGLIVMSVSPKFQRLGDLVAGTMVVDQKANLDPHVRTFTDSRVPQLAELIPTSFYVSNSLAKAVAAYADRREQLGVARAGEIAAKLSGTLCEQFGLPADTDPDLLICTLYYKIFVGESTTESDDSNQSTPSLASAPTHESRYQLPAPPIAADDARVSIVTDSFQVAEPVVLPAAPLNPPSTDSELE